MNVRLLSGVMLSLLAVVPATEGGTHGTLEGTVRDRRTGEALPGVNVLVLSLQQGSTSTVSGHFLIQSVRAGRHDIRFTRVGYRPLLVREVVVTPDLRTTITAEMEATDLELEEITVTQQRPLIQTDVTGTLYTVSAEQIAVLPIDNPFDVLRLKPGVTLEGNVRGGRSTEVLYLIDGLPVQDVLTGGASAQLPKSALVGLTLSTGGFEAQYGNALSGVVNMVSVSGAEEHRFGFRAGSDNLFGVDQTSKTTEIELSAAGPIIGQTLFYTAAMNGVLTDTRWWQDFQYSLQGPVDRLFSGLGKIDYRITPAVRLGAQILYSGRAWREYEFNWRYNLAGLPPEQRDAYRIAAILTHTVNPTFSYTASLSRNFVRTQIGEGSKESVSANEPYQYDLFLRYVIGGSRGWWASSRQESYTAKFDGTVQLHNDHTLRFGAEYTHYAVSSEVVKFEPQKTYFGKPLVNEPQLNFSSSYSFGPRAGGAYVQTRSDLLAEGLLLTAGLRYDFMDPTAARPAIEAIPVADTAYAFAVAGAVPASWKQQVSPRFGAAMQFSEQALFFLNVGWYFQYPLFQYLYTGLDRIGLAKGMSALTGNPDLEPERATLIELSYKHTFPLELVASLTYFSKLTKNLVDSKTFIPGDSKLAGNFGYAEYVNTPVAEARGFEFLLTRDRGAWVRGELSYVYMVAEGTSGAPDDGFYKAQFGFPPGDRVYPLSWDQRHTVKLLLTLEAPWDMRISTVTEWHSGRPYTNYPTATGFEKIDGGQFFQNNERMPAYVGIDIRAEQSFRPAWWPAARLTAYVDCRNLLNAANVRWVDSNGRVGGELEDPSGYFSGRRTMLGLLVQF